MDAVGRRPTWDEYARGIALNLLSARMARGLSQERLANLAGISSYTYQKFEKGESRPGAPMNPRLSTLVAVCSVLEVRIQDVLPPVPPDVSAR
ncbi:MAG: helix-turn-helix domain-containing protein [Marmoricola sp.]